MKAKLKSHANYVQMEALYDVFLLIMTMEAIPFNFEGHKHHAHALHDVKEDLYSLRQLK